MEAGAEAGGTGADLAAAGGEAVIGGALAAVAVAGGAGEEVAEGGVLVVGGARVAGVGAGARVEGSPVAAGALCDGGHREEYFDSRILHRDHLYFDDLVSKSIM